MDMGAGVTLLVFALAFITLALSKKDWGFEVQGNKYTVGELLPNIKLRRIPLILGCSLTVLGVLLIWSAVSTADGQTKVISPEGALSAPVYAGPSTISYRALPQVPVGTVLKLVCSAFGQPVRSATSETENRWDYAEGFGWLNYRNVTGGALRVNGCKDAVSHPSEGSTPPDATGPYSTYMDESADPIVYLDHSMSSNAVAHLRVTSLVRIKCTYVGGPVIPAPRALGSLASNNVWDYISSQHGWIPDSFVLTGSSTAVAPSC